MAPCTGTELAFAGRTRARHDHRRQPGRWEDRTDRVAVVSGTGRERRNRGTVCDVEKENQNDWHCAGGHAR